ncbi:MAG: dynamin family protein [Polyangiaceae bacterium]
MSLESLARWTAERIDGSAIPQDRIDHIEVGFPAELLRQRVVLVDTPGVNDLSHLRSEITYGYMTKSDAVLFVLDAGQLLKESEREFLQDKLIKNVSDKIVFVINKADIWSSSEREEALAYARSHLAKLVPDPQIFPISSQFELSGRKEHSGVGSLVDHLTKFLAEQRGTILLRQAASRGLNGAQVLEGSIEAKRRALKMTQVELAERIERLTRDQKQYEKGLADRRAMIRDEILAIKGWVGRDLTNLCDDIVRQLPGMIEKVDADDLKKHLGAFLEDAFRKWAEEESREIAIALERLAEKTLAHVKEDVRDAAQTLGSGFAVRAPTIEVDTFVYDVGVSILFAAGLATLFANLMVGGALTAAAPLLAIFVRRRARSETRKLALEMAPQVLKDASDKLRPELESLIDRFAEQLDQWVVLAGEEVFQNAMDVLLAAQKELDTVSSGGQMAVDVLDEQAKRLSSVRAKIEEMRPSDEKSSDDKPAAEKTAPPAAEQAQA